MLEVLEHLKEYDVLLHQDVVEGLDVLIAVLDGYAVAKAHALHLVIAEPDRGLLANEQALVLRGVGQRGERRDLVRAVDDDDIALPHAVAEHLVEVGSADMRVRRQMVDGCVDRAAHERGQRQVADGLAVLKVMIRALAVGAEVAGQIQRGVVVGNRSAGVVADQSAAAALRLRVEHLGQVDDAQVAHLVYAIRHGNFPPSVIYTL